MSRKETYKTKLRKFEICTSRVKQRMDFTSKTRLVANLIKNKSLLKQFKSLPSLEKKAADLLLGVVESALANAENEASQKDLSIDIENLYVSSIFVNKGPVHKMSLQN